MMHIHDNGRVAIGIEYTHGTVRILDHVPTSQHPPYIGVGQVALLPCGVTLLSGFCGSMTRAHCWLVLNKLKIDGHRVAYMERLDGHVAPFAEIITEGDFAGLWRVDLAQLRDRRRTADKE